MITVTDPFASAAPCSMRFADRVTTLNRPTGAATRVIVA
jgi:hypothetical protein